MSISQSEEEVERVAIAMTAKRVELINMRLGMDCSPGWDEYTVEGKQDARDEVKAVLAALATRSPVDQQNERANRICSCMEVYGEDPRCINHGRGTPWGMANPDICELAEKAAELDRIKAGAVDQQSDAVVEAVLREREACIAEMWRMAGQSGRVSVMLVEAAIRSRAVLGQEQQYQGVTPSSRGRSGGPTDPSPQAVSAVPAPATNAKESLS